MIDGHNSDTRLKTFFKLYANIVNNSSIKPVSNMHPDSH